MAKAVARIVRVMRPPFVARCDAAQWGDGNAYAAVGRSSIRPCGAPGGGHRLGVSAFRCARRADLARRARGPLAQEPLVGRVVRAAVGSGEVVVDPDAEIGEAVVLVGLEPHLAGLESEGVRRSDPAVVLRVGAGAAPGAVRGRALPEHLGGVVGVPAGAMAA